MCIRDSEYDDTFDDNDYYEDDYEEEDYREAMRSSRQRRANSSSSRNISLENEWFGDHFEAVSYTHLRRTRFCKLVMQASTCLFFKMCIRDRSDSRNTLFLGS